MNVLVDTNVLISAVIRDRLPQRVIDEIVSRGVRCWTSPRVVTLYQAGELKLRELVTRTYHLDGINDAPAALAAGEGARGIIRW